MWLARFLDKARLHQRGELSAEFEPLFGHRLATDGTFFHHFGLRFQSAMVTLQVDDSDEAMERWFLSETSISAEKITAWNTLAPRLGQPGEMMERAFRYAHRKYYGGDKAHPGVISVFTGIAWDEGYLDECPFTQVSE